MVLGDTPSGLPPETKFKFLISPNQRLERPFGLKVINICLIISFKG